LEVKSYQSAEWVPCGSPKASENSTFLFWEQYLKLSADDKDD
jgi:hypothetical protein